MSTIRPEVLAFVALGPLPPSSAEEAEIARSEAALRRIVGPVTDEEARLLMRQFGPDDCFGAAWTLVHLIETAPTRMTPKLVAESELNEWTKRLLERARRGCST